MAEEDEGAIGADWAMRAEGAEGAMGSEGVMRADVKGYISCNDHLDCPQVYFP